MTRSFSGDDLNKGDRNMKFVKIGTILINPANVVLVIKTETELLIKLSSGDEIPVRNGGQAVWDYFNNNADEVKGFDQFEISVTRK